MLFLTSGAFRHVKIISRSLASKELRGIFTQLIKDQASDLDGQYLIHLKHFESAKSFFPIIFEIREAPDPLTNI